MPARIYEGERDDIGHAYVRRFHPECRCGNLENGECGCDDDGTVSHMGTWREAFDHGHGFGGAERTARRG
jgi:hypothetical protein